MHGLIAALALLGGREVAGIAAEPRQAVSRRSESVPTNRGTQASDKTEPRSGTPALTDQEKSTKDAIAIALRRGLPLVQQAAARYPDHRKCFSCHHQTLPMLTMVAAREAGLQIDQDLMKSQAEFTRKSFLNDIERLREGKGIGGRAMTVGYALWALSLAKADGDDTTAAMVEYLFKSQHENGYWAGQVNRPPMEESQAFCTVLAIMGIRKYAAPGQKEIADAAVAKAKTWLAKVQPSSHEDRAARLWGMHFLDAAKDDLDAARNVILSVQRDDGGWSQAESMESDAYATGQSLFVLHSTGTPIAAQTYARGVAFLLKTQLDDGSWHVKSRSKPVQVYFDNGDPHDKDQFISTPATCWALVALSQR